MSLLFWGRNINGPFTSNVNSGIRIGSPSDLAKSDNTQLKTSYSLDVISLRNSTEESARTIDIIDTRINIVDSRSLARVFIPNPRSCYGVQETPNHLSTINSVVNRVVRLEFFIVFANCLSKFLWDEIYLSRHD